VVVVVVVVVGGWVGGRLGTATMAWKGHHCRETRVGEQRRMIWTWIFSVCLTNWSLPLPGFLFSKPGPRHAHREHLECRYRAPCEKQVNPWRRPSLAGVCCRRFVTGISSRNVSRWSSMGRPRLARRRVCRPTFWAVGPPSWPLSSGVPGCLPHWAPRTPRTPRAIRPDPSPGGGDISSSTSVGCERVARGPRYSATLRITTTGSIRPVTRRVRMWTTTS